MKRKEKCTSGMKKLNHVLVLPGAIAGILLVQIIFNFVIGIINSTNGIVSDNTVGLELLLSIIGIAVTVWVGLNIYNIYSKEELQKLLEKAEQASSIVRQLYTETLISKFKLIARDGTARYYASELNALELMPEDILEAMIDIEDIYCVAYDHYRQSTRSEYYFFGIKRVCRFSKLISIASQEKRISAPQRTFLKGYAALRKSDFSHFSIQNPCEPGYEKNKKAHEVCIEGYREGAKHLFGINYLPNVDIINSYTSEEQACISFIFNSIGAMQLHFRNTTNDRTVIIGGMNPIEVMQVAMKFSNSIPPIQLAVLERNLGAAYEHSGQMCKAFHHYSRSYNLDAGNWKTAYCIGSWYLKRIKCLHPTEAAALQAGEKLHVEKAIMCDIYRDLRRASYWFEIQKTIYHGIQHEKSVECLKEISCLTGSHKSRVAAARAKTDKRIWNEVVSEAMS